MQAGHGPRANDPEGYHASHARGPSRDPSALRVRAPSFFSIVHHLTLFGEQKNERAPIATLCI